MDTSAVVRQVRVWLREVVVGLDLCPFARGPLETGKVRIVVSEADDLEDALTDLWLELDRLVGTPARDLETTLLVLPRCMGDFDDFLDGCRIAERIVEERGYDGIVQIASFHPDYRFHRAPPDDPANHTNRSPHPIWHLLREESVSRAIDGHADVEEIPRRNARLMRTMDPRRLEAWRQGEIAEE